LRPPLEETFVNPQSNYPRLAMLIGDAWIRPEAHAFEPVLNPATEAVLGRLPLATTADLDAALQAAEAALSLWRAKGPRERARILKTGADLLRQRAEAIALTMTLEQGKPLAEARAEVLGAADVIEWYAEEGRRAYGRRPMPSPLAPAGLWRWPTG
jgi:succinate-semialdehyde dehydrogenase/glutarate-semialdehyde dehydrogenase